MKERVTITLREMSFHALVGTLPHEREHSQPVEVDISVHCESSREQEGDVPLIDYRVLYDTVHTIVMAGHTPLLEHLASRISRDLVAIDGVQAARVSVRKTRVAIPGYLAHAEVTSERERNA